MSWFRRRFLTGLLILLPILVTSWVFYQFFNSVDNILNPIVERYPFIDFPGLGFLGVLVIIFLTGVFGGNLIGRRVIGWLDTIVSRIPLISRMYIAVKQLSEVFLRRERTVFKKAVMIQYPLAGTFAVGFVTADSKFQVADGKKRDFLSVFLPTTPNPTSGFFLIVPAEEAIELDCSVEEALKMVISGGAVKPYFHGGEPIVLPGWAGKTKKDK
jgi:uncharacterized membrane protein